MDVWTRTEEMYIESFSPNDVNPICTRADLGIFRVRTL